MVQLSGGPGAGGARSSHIGHTYTYGAYGYIWGKGLSLSDLSGLWWCVWFVCLTVKPLGNRAYRTCLSLALSRSLTALTPLGCRDARGSELRLSDEDNDTVTGPRSPLPAATSALIIDLSPLTGGRTVRRPSND